MAMTCEGGGLAFFIAITFQDIHALDETVPDGVDVPQLGVREYVAFKILDELMNLDLHLAGITFDQFKHVHVRVEIRPLARPILPDLLFTHDPPPFRSLRPADAFAHQRKGAVYVSLVESSVGLRDHFLCIHDDSLQKARKIKDEVEPARLSVFNQSAQRGPLIEAENLSEFTKPPLSRLVKIAPVMMLKR
jgi:hypothetical protein